MPIIFVISLFNGEDDPETISQEKQKYNDEKLKIVLSDKLTHPAVVLFEERWQKVIKQCPGLYKYSSSLKFDKIYDNFDYAPEDAQRVSVTFLIPEEDGGDIPNEYRASGHHCSYEIMRDGTELMILKDPCISICLDKPVNHKSTDTFKLLLSNKKIFTGKTNKEKEKNTNFNKYTENCDVGNNIACFKLANLYVNEFGINKNIHKFTTLYRKSCEEGYPRACNTVAEMYSSGVKNEIIKDLHKAVEFYKKSCDGGYAIACNALGFMYNDGDEIQQNKNKAKYFFNIACNNGVKLSCKNYKILNEQGY